MTRSTTTRVLFVLVACLAAATAPESPRPVLAEEPPAPAAGSFDVDRAMTLPAFLREVEKRVPGLFTWAADDRTVARTTVRLGVYPLERAKLVPRMRAMLFPHEIVLLPSGAPPKETYAVVDMRMPVKPGDPVLEPVRVEIDTKSERDLAHQHGFFVTARIPATGLSHLDAVARVLRVVLTPENVGRIKRLPDDAAFEVTDFAPRVVLARRLARELATLQALGK